MIYTSQDRFGARNRPARPIGTCLISCRAISIALTTSSIRFRHCTTSRLFQTSLTPSHLCFLNATALSSRSLPLAITFALFLFVVYSLLKVVLILPFCTHSILFNLQPNTHLLYISPLYIVYYEAAHTLKTGFSLSIYFNLPSPFCHHSALIALQH